MATEQGVLFEDDGEKVRRCCTCREIKPLSEFYFSSRAQDVRRRDCKPCTKAYLKNRYGEGFLKAKIDAVTAKASKRNKEALWAYLLLHPCMDCGEGNPLLLQFDHREGQGNRNRRPCVTSMLGNAYAWKSIAREIAKCDVVCANCHVIRTFARGGSWKLRMIEETERQLREGERPSIVVEGSPMRSVTICAALIPALAACMESNATGTSTGTVYATASSLQGLETR